LNGDEELGLNGDEELGLNGDEELGSNGDEQEPGKKMGPKQLLAPGPPRYATRG